MQTRLGACKVAGKHEPVQVDISMFLFHEFSTDSATAARLLLSAF